MTRAVPDQGEATICEPTNRRVVMSSNSVSPADREMPFAKDRLKQYANRMEDGASLPRGVRHKPVHDPEGLTARMRNGTTVVVYRCGCRSGPLSNYLEFLEYAVVAADGSVTTRTTLLDRAIGRALGGYQTFAIGQHGTVSVNIRYRSRLNTLTLDLSIRVVNSDAERWYEPYLSESYSTRDRDTVWLAVGLLADPRMGNILPLLDRVQEVRPDLARAVGCLFVEPVSAERLKRMECR
jgi:hypothetical protein